MNEFSQELRRYVHGFLAASVDAQRHSFAQGCAYAEELVNLLLKSVIQEILTSLAERQGFQASHRSWEYDSFEYNGRRYRLITERTIGRVFTLRICQAGPFRPSLIVRHELETQDCGLFHLEYDRSLSTFRDHLIATTQSVVDSGYNWLETRILDFIRQDSLTRNELASEVLRVLPPALAERVWLYSVIDDFGIAIPNEGVVGTAIVRTATQVARPFSHIAGLLTQSIRFQDLISLHAFRKRASVNAPLDTAGYANRHRELCLAAQAAFRAVSICIQPLVLDGSTLLFAGYPAELENAVKSRLTLSRVRFSRAVESHASGIRQVLANCQPLD